MVADATRKVVLAGGRVLAMDGAPPGPRDVAISAGRVSAVGPIPPGSEPAGARRIDCRGWTLLPGLCDAHLHFFAYASAFDRPVVDPYRVRSVAELLDGLSRIVAASPAARVIEVGWYDERQMAEGRHPSRRDLDAVEAERPLRLKHRNGHVDVLNSTALARLLELRRTLRDDSGWIDLDGDGRPTGLLVGCRRLLRRLFPASPPSDEACRAAAERLLGLGITAFVDASPGNGVRAWERFGRLQSSGVIPQRVTMLVGTGSAGRGSWPPPDTTPPGARLRAGPVKVPLGPGGFEWRHLDALRGLVDGEAVRRLGAAFHALEPEDVWLALEVLGASGRDLPVTRLEHLARVPPPLAERLGALGAVASTQPAFVYWNGAGYLRTLPPREETWLYPLRSLLDAGIPLAFGSDAPVVPPDPWVGIAAAVGRRDRSGTPVGGEQAIGRRAAIEAYTTGARAASGWGALAGRIVPGCEADLVVVDRDLETCSEGELVSAKVLATWTGGELSWADPLFAARCRQAVGARPESRQRDAGG
ncbi:MAG TPA: amidohydrolase family protein [Thermodesulfobacteriota bacterium]